MTLIPTQNGAEIIPFDPSIGPRFSVKFTPLVTAKDFSVWLDITGLMLSSTFILALLMR